MDTVQMTLEVVQITLGIGITRRKSVVSDNNGTGEPLSRKLQFPFEIVRVALVCGDVCVAVDAITCGSTETWPIGRQAR